MGYELEIYGSPALREKAEPVAAVDDGIRQLVRDMLDVMYDRGGLGLAAEQIGRREAICVIDVPPEQDTEDGVRRNPDVAMPLALINPGITDRCGAQTGPEGCLSFPEIFVNVRRADEVTVEFLDLQGERRSLRAAGLLARAVQHELDHLDGVLLVDRMSPVQRAAVAGRLKRLRKSSARNA